MLHQKLGMSFTHVHTKAMLCRRSSRPQFTHTPVMIAMQKSFVGNTLHRLGRDVDNLSSGLLLLLHNILHERKGKHLFDAVVILGNC